MTWPSTSNEYVFIQRLGIDDDKNGISNHAYSYHYHGYYDATYLARPALPSSSSATNSNVPVIKEFVVKIVYPKENSTSPHGYDAIITNLKLSRSYTV
jgi:hypothetical protein